jgi:hypothetical protein
MQLDAEIFDKLRAISWFSKCAETPNTDLGFNDVEWIQNWSIAVKSFTSLNWENTTLEARNALTLHLSKRHQNDYQDWNKLTVQARE